jgi:hypothetical protein
MLRKVKEKRLMPNWSGAARRSDKQPQQGCGGDPLRGLDKEANKPSPVTLRQTSLALPEPRPPLERTSSGTLLTAQACTRDALNEHIASITRPCETLQPWAKQAIARTLQTNIGILHRQPDGTHACEWVCGQSLRSVLVIKSHETWQVWIPDSVTADPLHQRGHALDVPLTGSDGFVFAAALAADYRGSAAAFALGHQGPSERTQSLVNHPIFKLHAQGAAPTLPSFAKAVSLSLRLETQQHLASHPGLLTDDLWHTCAQSLRQTKMHNATVARLPAGDSSREKANAAAFCLINEVAQTASALGRRVADVVDKQRNELEARFW